MPWAGILDTCELAGNYDAKYLLASVAIAVCGVGWTIWYEASHGTSDSLADTVTAIGQGISAAIAVAIFIVAVGEIVMVIARRINQRRDEAKLEEGRQQERRAWIEWLERQTQAIAAGEEFTEPSPAQKEANSSEP